MQSVRLHVAGNGVVWALSKCRGCGEVTKHLAADAIVSSIACKRCGRLMDMKGATIEAVAAARDHGGSSPPQVE
jgi:hypothetical protein